LLGQSNNIIAQIDYTNANIVYVSPKALLASGDTINKFKKCPIFQDNNKFYSTMV
jgi:hypothetical protein